ncbi:dimethylamine monooxygenase subunit DmmA family protein [Arthrobacter sp. Z4-13]
MQPVPDSRAAASAAGGNGPGFRGVICVSFGKPAVPAPEDAPGALRQHLDFESADREALSCLQLVLSDACVGVRLVLAGPPADVHAAAAAAAGCGLVEEEIEILQDTGEPSTVFCGHCHTTARTQQQPGSNVVCQGCGTVLIISSHFSRRQASYLGYAAHAEEAA